MENVYSFEDIATFNEELMRVEFEAGPDGRSYPDAESEEIVGEKINFVIPKLGGVALNAGEQ